MQIPIIVVSIDGHAVIEKSLKIFIFVWCTWCQCVTNRERIIRNRQCSRSSSLQFYMHSSHMNNLFVLYWEIDNSIYIVYNRRVPWQLNCCRTKRIIGNHFRVELVPQLLNEWFWKSTDVQQANRLWARLPSQTVAFCELRNLSSVIPSSTALLQKIWIIHITISNLIISFFLRYRQACTSFYGFAIDVKDVISILVVTLYCVFASRRLRWHHRAPFLAFGSIP